MIVTAWPDVIDVALSTTSNASVVLTERLLTMVVPPPSLIRASAAVPLVPAVPDFGVPNKVSEQSGR